MSSAFAIRPVRDSRMAFRLVKRTDPLRRVPPRAPEGYPLTSDVELRDMGDAESKELISSKIAFLASGFKKGFEQRTEAEALKFRLSLSATLSGPRSGLSRMQGRRMRLAPGKSHAIARTASPRWFRNSSWPSSTTDRSFMDPISATRPSKTS